MRAEAFPQMRFGGRAECVRNVVDGVDPAGPLDIACKADTFGDGTDRAVIVF